MTNTNKTLNGKPVRIVYGGNVGGFYVDLYVGSIRHLSKVTNDYNVFEQLKKEFDAIADKLNDIKYKE